VTQWTQSHRAASAQTIGQHNGLNVCPRIHGLKVRLQRGTKLIRAVVQTDFKEARLFDVSGSASQKFDFLLNRAIGVGVLPTCFYAGIPHNQHYFAISPR